MNTVEFENSVSRALKNLPSGAVLLAAVSGGADSIAMLAALAALKNDTFSLRCIHVEHGIRPAEESGGDAEFTRRFCKNLRVPCRIVSVPPGKIEKTAKKFNTGIEAAARLFRRRIFFREARRIETESGPEGPRQTVMIATAHTKDDKLETALMRVLRGSGPSGLAAMPAVRGRFLRPVLELNRRDILAYLAEKNTGWREDATNTDTIFFRNRVRHRLIPLLDESFPQWRTAVSSLAETQALTAGFIKNEAKRRIEWKPGDGGSLYTNAENFFSQPEIIREEALFQGINRLQKGKSLIPREIKRANIRRFSRGKITAADLGPVRLRNDSKRIIMTSLLIPHSSFNNSETGFSLLINAPGLYKVKEVTVEVKPCCDNGGELEGGFYACLPFVLRSGGKGDGEIIAEGLQVCGGDPSARKETGMSVFCIVRGTYV